ncbi:hypothetical protein SAMN05216268_13154 [Streptomyces yunnanensis]|uniref:Uncharacterized protein n=1 Tax=Streptomyces yunnanensis TaxID=156453 RepID=A0A9X8N8T9_9ACTN|nr:hypothetical protein SAMN05216268_13154 [Streptomyces yunnanensis]
MRRLVIGSSERALYGNQFTVMAPLFDHNNISVRIPELGGAADPQTAGHEELIRTVRPHRAAGPLRSSSGRCLLATPSAACPPSARPVRVALLRGGRRYWCQRSVTWRPEVASASATTGS